MIRLLRPRTILALCFLPAGPLAVCAQAPVAATPEPAPVPSSFEQQKEKELRGPPLADAYLSALTPQAREMTDFVDIKESETSPFGMVANVIDQRLPAAPQSEEEKIQTVLRAMRVTGLMESPSGPRVLLGSLSLGVGDSLPKLFADQLVQLKVKSINNRGVVLSFVQQGDSQAEKSIGLPIDLVGPNSERVSSLLVGEAFLKVVPLDQEGNPALPPLQNEAAQKALEAAEAGGFQSIIERKTELLNAPAEPASSDEGQNR